MNKPDGGPAFPLMPPAGLDGLYAAGYPEPHPGLTLRQLYAGMAMQTLLAEPVKFADQDARLEWFENTAIASCRAADVLLKALAAADAASSSPWRPIEEAPKDGTEILIYGETARNIARWDATAGEFLINGFDYAGRIDGFCYLPPIPQKEGE